MLNFGPKRWWMLLVGWLPGWFLVVGTATPADLPITPLPVVAAGSNRIQAALVALRRQDPQALMALRDADWLLPWAIPESDDPSLERPWTDVLARLIAAQPPALASALIQQLNERYRRQRSHGEERSAGRLAAIFRPAPEALTEIIAESNLAYDRGELRRSLALGALAPPYPADSPPGARDRAVLILSGLGAVVEPERQLPAPGMPVPIAEAPGDISRPAGVRVTWALAPGYLLALDPWGRVRWQRRIAADSTPCPGNGGTLLRGDGGVALIREDGSLTPPAQFGMPADAQPLAVAGGAAWCSRGSAILRANLSQASLASFTLPSPPCGAPLVRGSRSLWLTRDDLLLYDQVQLVGTMHHALHALPNWSLSGRDGHLIMHGDGRSWQVPDLTQQLEEMPPAGRATLLSHASRHAEVMALVHASPALAEDAAARQAVLRACFALPYSLADQALALTVERTPQEAAWVDAWLACQAAPAPGSDWEAQLHTLTEAHPEILLPRDRRQLAHEEDHWEHVISGAAWNRAVQTVAEPWPAQVVVSRPLAKPVALVPTPPEAPAVMALDQGDDFTEVTWSAADNSLLWRHRWQSLPVPSGAPNRTHALRDGLLLIGEGASRLVLIDCRLGDVLGTIDLTSIDVEPSQTVVLGTDPVAGIQIAMLHPVAIDDQVTLADTHGHERTVQLPTPARWMVRAPGGCLVLGLATGQGLVLDAQGTLHPALVPVELMQAHADSRRSTAAGVMADGLLFPWAR
jgi:hypothetical protein